MDSHHQVHAELSGATATAVRTKHGWEAELATTAGVGPEVGAPLIAELIAKLEAQGGGMLRWRVARPTEAHRAIAVANGFDDRRRLVQLRRSLPLPWSTDLSTRPFDADVDIDAWLEVNNAAFHWHPEQGGWTRDDLVPVLDQSWFDASGFLIHPAEGPIKGFCWTKIHRDLDPPMGEIFVIGVHPDHHGQGLGRSLALAGFDHLSAQGLTEGMLYTEADNRPALGLYQDLGFDVDHEIVVFERQVGPASELADY